MSNKIKENVSVFRANSRSNDGILKVLRYFVEEPWRFRSHIRVVFAKQFRSAYYGTGLGVFWNYVIPLVPLTVYWLISNLRVFPGFDRIDGAATITFGVTLWFLFAGFVQVPIQVVATRNVETMKTAFPLVASIFSGFSQLIFDTAVRSVFVLLIVVLGESSFTWHAMFLPIILLPALMFFVGVGLLLSILNVVTKDVSRLVNIALQYGIFISGVIFPVENINFLATLNAFNPFAQFIELSRSMAFLGEFGDLKTYAWMSVAGVIQFIIGLRIFYIMEYRIRGIG